MRTDESPAPAPPSLLGRCLELLFTSPLKGVAIAFVPLAKGRRYAIGKDDLASWVSRRRNGRNLDSADGGGRSAICVVAGRMLGRKWRVGAYNERMVRLGNELRFRRLGYGDFLEYPPRQEDSFP